MVWAVMGLCVVIILLTMFGASMIDKYVGLEDRLRYHASCLEAIERRANRLAISVRIANQTVDELKAENARLEQALRDKNSELIRIRTREGL